MASLVKGIQMKILVLARQLAACAFVAALGNAIAAPYPDRPIRMLVPFGAGGITDVVARVTAEQLSKELGQPVIVDNKPGAGGNIAAGALVQAPSDGYTLMLATIGMLTVNPHLYQRIPFDPFKSFTYISTVAATPHAVVINSNLKIDSFAALVHEARKKPGGLTFATAGTGSSPHQGLETFQRAAGVKLLAVPLKVGQRRSMQ
jgi:tripartite-type tricarboxylate transporter receptor subunit TctC